MKRIMIAGTNSGCGKTTITCAILQALKNRGVNVSSFKCGPDYIDPMFHRKITGIPSYNLDRWFCSKKSLNKLLKKNQTDFSVIEGVMGFYDGVDEESSSCGISLDTNTPAIIVIDCKGMSQSIGAVIQGFLNYRRNNIAGFIFNRLPESLIEQTKEICWNTGTEYLGHFPVCPECQIQSRHLGLLTAYEIDDIKNKMRILAENAEKHLLLDRIYEIGKSAPTLSSDDVSTSSYVHKNVKIAVARDEVFCFYYEENFEMLRELGCDIVFFSPINNDRLPENISGLWIGGGYPELYAEKLSVNKNMLNSIKTAVNSGLPTIAECGGFLYLNRELEDKNGNIFNMVGVFDGKCYPTDKLQRFGYAELTALSDNLLCHKGEKLKTHEFHYWDCTDCGDGFHAQRSRNRQDKCVHASDTVYAGFPHLYLPANLKAAERFVNKCMRYRNGTNK